MGCDTGHPRDFRHDSGGGDAGYDPSGGGGGHPAHFDPMPDTFHAEFITQVQYPSTHFDFNEYNLQFDTSV